MFVQTEQPATVAFLGDEGRINLVSLKSRQLTGSLKMAGSARAAAFSPDGNQLLSLGTAPRPYSVPYLLLSHDTAHNRSSVAMRAPGSQLLSPNEYVGCNSF